MRPRRGRGWFVLCLLVALAACQQTSFLFGSVTPGMSQAEVRRRAGPPTEQRSLPQGETAWYYVNGPQGYTTYRVRFSREGHVSSVEQVLTEDNFTRKIKPLFTTREQLLEELGRPADIAKFPRMGEEVWKYRYRDAATAMINDVHVDEETGVVKRIHLYLDPGYAGLP